MNFDDYAGMLLRKDAQGNISPALGFVINPFDKRFIQIWINLLDNAIKFSPSKGTITMFLKQDVYKRQLFQQVFRTCLI